MLTSVNGMSFESCALDAEAALAGAGCGCCVSSERAQPCASPCRSAARTTALTCEALTISPLCLSPSACIHRANTKCQ